MTGFKFADILLEEGIETLSTPKKITFTCNLGNKTLYHISMNNHFLSPRGHVTKTQTLSASYIKVAAASITPKSVIFTYTWDDVNFNSDNWHGESSKTKWTFAKGLRFSNIMTYPTPIMPENDKGGSNDQIDFIGIDYSHLVELPTVNLLYMLSWDVTGFEEMTSYLARSLGAFTEVGEYVEIDTVSDTCVYLEFSGCKQDSFFHNGRFEAAFIGVSTWKGHLGALFEYKCIGKLEVNNAKNKSNAISQTGSSYYFGKVLIDFSTGKLLRGDMVEQVTGVIINKKNKWVPQQKRRFVLLELA
ncbi:hypothetical protein PV797_10510 [Clostridiaceae bacterium M8S5]|nr:hypothetical protein PV797_10510 [Clostridiaceae bacterium M8S5]